MAETLEGKRSQPIPWLEKYSSENVELARMVQQAFTMSSANSDPVCELARQLEASGATADVNDEVMGFLNSNAVRNHLKEINYQFNAVEAAYVVYWSRTKSTVEKLCAWTRIINELPDARDGMDRYLFLRNGPEKKDLSLHEVLHEYILKVVASLDGFFSLKNGCYYQSYMTSSSGKTWGDWGNAYSGADLCIADALEEWEDEEEDLVLWVRKGCLFNKDRRPNEVMLRNNVLVSADVFEDTPTRFEDIDYFFKSLWLPIPCPFKKGDIVYDPADSNSISSFCGGMMVVTSTSYERYCETKHRGADNTDMSIYGYFQREDCSIYHEVTYDYLNMEYAPSEMLTDKSRVLLAVSRLLRGEIDVALFSEVLLHVVFEELADRNSFSKYCWAEETLESLGFSSSDSSR